MKKFIAVLLVMVMAFAVASEAFACSSTDLKNAELYRRVNTANALIEQYVRVAKATPYDDVDWLLWQIDMTVQPVMAYASRIGAVVVCEMRPEYIDGRWVDIDPLHVVNLGDDDNDKGKK